MMLTSLASRLLALVVLLAFTVAALPVAALGPDVQEAPRGPLFIWEQSLPDNYVMQARDTQDVESHGGYTSEYIFGMTKGVMRSTLEPAIKPIFLLFTIPLDLVFLPFAAIGGFFR